MAEISSSCYVYSPSLVERKWQVKWNESSIFAAFIDYAKPKYYVLEMLPYPSGRIHMGHLRNYTIGDVIARFKRAQGYNVLYTMGWDAFGLPAENAAINKGIHPKDWTIQNINFMKAQLKKLGLSYDWSREIATCLQDYYKHEQSIFIDFYSQGFVYQKESLVNWDPVDSTVLANEQVIDGRGWRSGAIVEQKSLKQWFFKITSFSEKLLEGLKILENGWPEKVLLMQERWIERSEGVLISFKLFSDGMEKNENFQDVAIEVFTTRPETIFGASFIAISYDHPILNNISKSDALNNFIIECKRASITEAALETVEKLGFDTGMRVSHPLDDNIILPVYIGNFVLMHYGTGAIFGCPAHDTRDFLFAKKYGLPIKAVVLPESIQGEKVDWDFSSNPYLEHGVIINSRFLNGLSIKDAKHVVIQKLEECNVGKQYISYRLRDWGVSRQRYWGCPIPIIYCKSCGVLPLPKENLPVLLPDDVSFEKSGNPLALHPTWKKTKCHVCGGEAERETDTLDTFVDSSWYFLRYCSPHFHLPIDKEAVNYWLPVDRYIGGIEHAVMHLLYARFFSKALTQLGYLNLNEPFLSLLTQGMITHETYKDCNGNWRYPSDVIKKNGAAFLKENGESISIGRTEKMSKSKCNVVEPDFIIENYGADTARLFLMSDSPPDRDVEWSDDGVEGASRFLHKLYKSIVEVNSGNSVFVGEMDNEKITKMMHRAIRDVTHHISNDGFHKTIAIAREFFNSIQASKISLDVKRDALLIILRLLNPIVPHITEELWEISGCEGLLANQDWPIVDEKYLIDDIVNIVVQINGKTRLVLQLPTGLNQSEVESMVFAVDNIKNAMLNKEIKKVIYIPNKIINLVCS